LVERHPVCDAQPATAVLDRPAQTGQPGGGELAIPFQAFLERLVLATRPAQPLERGVFADQVVGQPLTDLSPELMDLYHPCRLTYQALALLGASMIRGRTPSEGRL